MTLRSRQYRGPEDLRPLMRFLQEANGQEGPLSGYFHIGDLIWGIYQNTIYDPQANIRLWEQDGALVGFVWFEEPGLGVPLPHPDVRGDAQLLEEMLGWMTDRALTLQAADPEASVWTRLLDIDGQLRSFFSAHGFTKDEYHMEMMGQPLEAPPAPLLPEGFSVRHVGGEAEWQARVDLHRAVWHPSKVTLPAYRNLRAAPGYDPELDLVVVAPDGTFVAYCICWLDEQNRVGEFEPVGTHPDYRGQGLGKAVIQEGLRRLHARGARQALVYSVASNKASHHLYRSAGFQIITREHLYGKTLRQAPLPQ